MALSCKVVDLVRLDFLDDPYEIGGIGKISIVHAKKHILLVRISIKMINPPCVE